MLTISPSKIQQADCPYKFHKDYLTGDRPEDGPTTPVNLLVGKFVHAVLDFYTKALMNTKSVSDFTLFEEIFDKAWEYNEWIPNSLHDEIKSDLTAYVETFVIDLQHTWRSEVEIALTWDGLRLVSFDDPGAWLRCKLDRVEIYPDERMAVIRDYKTARYIPSESKLKKNLQSIIYPFAMHKLNPYLEKFRMVFDYVRWNKQVPLTYVLSNPQEGEILLEPDKIEKQLRGFTTRLQAKIDNPESMWPAIRGELCAICNHDCPLVEAGLEPCRSIERAQEIAMQIEALSDKQKELRGMLQDYIKGTDQRVEVHNGHYAYMPSISVKYKVSDVVAYCMEHGMDLNKLLKFDSDKFNKLEEDEHKAAIRSIGKPSKPSSRFRFIKDTQQEDDNEEGE